MKTILMMIILALTPLFAQDGLRVAWNSNLADIQWTEIKKDPSATAGTVPFSILTGPYIGWKSDTSAVICWEVVAAKTLTVSPFASFSATYPDSHFAMRVCTLSGLLPAAEYRYRLSTLNAGFSYSSAEYSFKTLPASGPFSFQVLGDPQRGTDTLAFGWAGLLYDLMTPMKPALVLWLGDITYGASCVEDGTNGRKVLYRAFNACRPLMSSAWMAPVMGNHDIALSACTDYFAPYYFQGIPKCGSNDSLEARPPYYYSYDIGDCHFTAVCSEVRSVSGGVDWSDSLVYGGFSYNQHLAWLREDLGKTGKRWKIAYLHEPLHTNGGYPIPEGLRQDFGRLFDEFGVQIIISGHDHSYQRSKRINNLTRALTDSGSVQLVSGGAANFFGEGAYKPYIGFRADTNHFVTVDVTKDTLFFTATTKRGNLLDQWKLPYYGQPVIAPFIPAPADPTAFLPPRTCLTFSPNPSDGSFSVRLSGVGRTNAPLKLYDIRGGLAGSWNLNLDQGDIRLSLTALPRGLYLARVTAGTFKAESKIILR